MSSFHALQSFVREANRLSHLADLNRLLDDTGEALGFDYFALIHHVDLASPPEQTVALSNYPPTWGEMVMARRYFVEDPIYVACQKTASGFLWSNIRDVITLNRRQETILQSAAREGLNEGYTVPVHVPGEFAGSCSFALRAGRRFSAEDLPNLQYVGCFAFEAARRIASRTAARRDPGRQAEPAPELTDRQLDCVVLVAKGQSDRQIAASLQISEETAHKHVENAKARYGVPTRTQLVVRALFDAKLAFADVVRKPGVIT